MYTQLVCQQVIQFFIVYRCILIYISAMKQKIRNFAPWIMLAFMATVTLMWLWQFTPVIMHILGM